MKHIYIQYIFKRAVRFVFKDKKVLFIKVFGLTISLAVALLIFGYIHFEKSFDTFHSNVKQIYRVESNFYDGDDLTAQWATSSFGYASAMKENLPEIEDYTRVGVFETSGVVNYLDKKLRFREDGLAYAEPSFFNLFSFNLLEGDQKTALEGIGKVVITKDIATTYFGDENPLGKVLKFSCPRREFECEVSGVLENFPKNSHIRYDFLISYKTLPRWAHETWYLHEAYSYVLLKPGTNPDKVVAAFPKMAEKYKTRDALKNKTWGIDLNPLQDIHLSPKKLYEREDKGNKSALGSLFLVAIAILVMALINYVNISTATAIKRAKEVSLQKVAGSPKGYLIGQFLMESFVINGLALLGALSLVFLSENTFVAFFDHNMDLGLFRQSSFWIFLAIIFVGSVLLSGLYPSILLSSIDPIKALKGKIVHSKTAINVRKVLVVVQFVMTIVMICSILVISKQIVYMLHSPLGFNASQKLVVQYPGATDNRTTKVTSFKDEIKQITGVRKISSSSSVPGMEAGFFFSNKRVEDVFNTQSFEMIASDGEFIETYGMELIAGRDYIKDSEADQDKVLVNETGMKTFGYTSAQEAVGSKVLLEGIQEPFEIIGVVKDFHQQSLRKAVPPIVFFPYQRIRWIPLQTITIELGSANIHQNISRIETSWKKFFPENTFDIFFVDTFYNSQYRAEKKFLTVLGFFAMLAIFLALLGLWSLTVYENSLRVKEIGIRKVNGAKVTEILAMLNKDFVKWVAIAFVIACPIAWYAMNRWLENFAYKTTLSWWIFALAGVLALGIALLTVSFQSWKAATRNPVEALRQE